jgi:hypothetical protein
MTSFLKRKSVNINLDTDGLLSYLFIRLGGFEGELSGYNNSRDLILSTYPTISEMWDDVFIDIFVGRKDTLCIDQHIISDSFENNDYGENKINPHLLIENHISQNVSYFQKFPFSSCLFILAMLEREGNITSELNLLQPTKYKEFNVMDMILRADGVLQNYVKYNRNVKDWADKLIRFSNNGKNTTRVMNYLLGLSFDEANTKSDAVSDFYIKQNLTKDGGYNQKISLEENITILNKLLKAFSLYLGIGLKTEEKKFFIYKGEPFVTCNWQGIRLDELETYAFVGKNKLSYTKGFHNTDNSININIDF